MEAVALFSRFKDNLDLIVYAFNSKLEVRTMPYNTSVPLEINLLADILRLHGLEYTSNTPGALAVNGFQQWLLQNEAAVSDVMQRVLNDKKAYMRTQQGVVLQKEMLIRRLEFFNETAHTLAVMIKQQNLASPRHFSYPLLNG
ncbi:hypothetical protein [Pontibacter harenae]|uniref:hypothetical protein n=1 Tax=Pontibacter harenae TaxID=2894083 RepID=UPI001E43910A|nr:hypothetical protein [Pontibacter harenae]MCC9165936.1 hypothetical protein [Pontibacter harenae]